MVRFAAYGILYQKGKKVTKQPFRISTGKTAKTAKTKALRDNRRWNKIKTNKKHGWSVKFSHTRKVKK